MATETKSPSAGDPGGPGVLCGTDFSPSATAAADVAAAMARRWNATLDLVHADVLPADINVADRMAQEAARLGAAGATVRAHVAWGLPDEALVARAKPDRCRLLVVGALGKRTMERWVLGSVAERTAERAPVPTVVVRDAAPLCAWARGERRLRVLVAFDFSRSAEAALAWVQELRSFGPCDVIVGHVYWPPEQRARLGGAGPLPLAGSPAEIVAAVERDLRARMAEFPGGAEYQLRVEANWGRADVRLAELARAEGADLLVTGSHQYHGFERMWHGSVSRGLLHNAAMNVAVVPLAAGAAAVPAFAGPAQHVIVATDFSDAGNRAVAQAFSLVPRGGAVHLVHVVHPQSLKGGEFLQTLPDAAFTAAHASHTATLAARLRALIPEAAAAHGVAASVEIVNHRDPAAGILQAAERLGAEVICVGTHGGTGRFDTLLGSVAQQVVSRSRRPVLVVPSPRE